MGLENRFGPGRDGLAKSLHMGFVNKFRSWARFLTASLGDLCQLPPALLGPACV